jgi:hypothetical protein
MPLLRTALLLIALMLPFLAGADEQEERNQVRAVAHEALLKKDFAALRALYVRFSTTDLHTSSGYPKLDPFFNAIVELPNGASDKLASYLDDRDAMTLKWVTDNPGLPMAVILHARSLLAHGWYFRGQGPAGSVSSDGMAKFKDYANRAGQFLNRHREIGSRDVGWYVAYVDVGMALAWATEGILNIANEAFAKFPDDSMVPRMVIVFLLPKWHGDVDVLDDYINRVTLATQSRLGMEMYARLYIGVGGNQFDSNLFNDTKISWPKFKQGLEDLRNRYPTDWNVNMYAYHACLAGDEDKTRELTALVGDRPVLSRWGLDAQQNFDNCRSWKISWFARNPIERSWPSWLIIIAVACVVGAISLSMSIYASGAKARFRARVEKWEKIGLLQSVEYESRKVLLVLDSDGHVGHLFLELVDGGVLHLDGGSLHVFDGGADHSSKEGAPVFPSRRFKVLRHLEPDRGVYVENHGPEIEPDQIEHVSDAAIIRIESLEDGKVLANASLEQVLAAVAGVHEGAETLFGGKPWLEQVVDDRARLEEERGREARFFSLGPRLLLAAFSTLFGVVMIAIAPPSLEQFMPFYAFGGFCLSIAVACVFRGRIARFFASLVATVVFGAALAYLGSELLGGALISASRSEPSVLNALFFLVVFGLPAAVYVWRARFGFSIQDNKVVWIRPDDALMVAAYGKAQASIDKMRQLFEAQPSDVAVRYLVKTDQGAPLLVWGRLLELSQYSMSVSMETPPLSSRGSTPAPLSLPLRELKDWHVALADGSIRGSFTAQAQIAHSRRSGQSVPSNLAPLENRYVDF